MTIPEMEALAYDRQQRLGVVIVGHGQSVATAITMIRLRGRGDTG